MDHEGTTINIDALRRELMDYFGTATTGGFLMAVIDLSRVERASAEELIRMARDVGIDVRKYKV